MTDGYFSWNSQVDPLPSLLVNSTPIIQLANPVLYQICSFFQQILNTNLMPRWSQECAACGMTHANIDAFIDNLPVAQTVSFPVDDLLQEANEFLFPLLSIHEVESSYQQWTLTNTAVRTTYCLTWILPPMVPLQYNRLYNFLHYADEVILGYGAQGYDPKVNTNSVWRSCNVSFGSFHGSQRVKLDGLLKGSPKSRRFEGLEVYFSFQERNQLPVPQNFPHNFTEATIQLNYVDGYNPANAIDNLIDGYVFPNITLTSCSPNTGSFFNGNTLLNINGTGFSKQAIPNASQLTVVGAPVKSLTVLSPTCIMAITNPAIHGTQGVLGNIVLTDLDGNTYTLSDSFTYQ